MIIYYKKITKKLQNNYKIITKQNLLLGVISMKNSKMKLSNIVKLYKGYFALL